MNNLQELNLNNLPVEEINEDELFVPVALDEKKSEHIAAEPYSYWKSVFRVFIKKPGAIIALTSLVIFLLCILIIPMFTPDGYLDSHVTNEDFQITGIKPNMEPSKDHLFGTDEIGRDLFFAVFKGARKSLLLAIISSAACLFIGTFFGLIWGFFRKLDPIFIELYNLVSNIPSLLIYLLLAKIFSEAFPTTSAEVRLIISLSLLGWIGLARFIRNQVLIITNREYNVASKTLGTPPLRIMSRNLLPYILAVVITEASLIIPGMISSEVSMSYFGVGLTGNSIAIGAILKMGMSNFSQYPWQLLAPAFILAWIIFTFFLFGISLSDALDPKKHR